MREEDLPSAPSTWPDDAGRAAGASLEVLAEEVACLIRRSELRCAFEVGRVVAERLFTGDPGAWHRPGPKARSLARLADLLASRGIRGSSTLSRCLATYEVLESCRDIATSQCLTPSHVHAVLALPRTEQHRLLREAEAGRWTVATIVQRARRAPGHSGRGRPRSPAFVGGVRRVLAALEPAAPAFHELERVADVDPALVEQLHAGLLRARERLEALQQALSPKRAEARRAGAAGDSPRVSRESQGSQPRLRRID